MRRTHLSSADNAGTGGVSELVEISEHETKAARSVPDDVLTEHVGGAQLVHNGCELGPEPACVFGAAAASGGRLGLAGVAARDDVDHRPWLGAPPVERGTDVVMARHSRPVSAQHALSEGVDLDLADDMHARPVEAQADSPDAREQLQHVHGQSSVCWTYQR